VIDDELAARRARRRLIEPPGAPNCRCIATPLEQPGALRRAWAWVTGWRSRRRVARILARLALLDALADLGTTYGAGWTGRSIAAHARALSRGAVRFHQGNLYPALRGLEADGFVESWEGLPTASRGWRPPRYYRLTAHGRAAVLEGA
jgi:uncharacterized protein YjiS (DUF1127 family)